jgi:hypothetical protein
VLLSSDHCQTNSVGVETGQCPGPNRNGTRSENEAVFSRLNETVSGQRRAATVTGQAVTDLAHLRRRDHYPRRCDRSPKSESLMLSSNYSSPGAYPGCVILTELSSRIDETSSCSR